jgi:glycolate oxidase iron-sulfur subunit
MHSGRDEESLHFARKLIERFEQAPVDTIVINSAGCGSHLKDYGRLFRGDPVWAERARAFSAKVKDVHEFLAQIDLNKADLQPLPLKVTYQEPCHLAHAQRITAQPRQLLNAIPQLQLVEMNESALCCGSAGVYNITQPELATALGARKIENALATGAGVIATANPGCALQLAGELRKRGRDVQVRYIVELLDESYRGGRLKAQT